MMFMLERNDLIQRNSMTYNVSFELIEWFSECLKIDITLTLLLSCVGLNAMLKEFILLVTQRKSN